MYTFTWQNCKSHNSTITQKDTFTKQVSDEPLQTTTKNDPERKRKQGTGKEPRSPERSQSGSRPPGWDRFSSPKLKEDGPEPKNTAWSLVQCVLVLSAAGRAEVQGPVQPSSTWGGVGGGQLGRRL